MCGMFGVISGENRWAPAAKYIKDSFLAGQVRGVDSSGLLQIDNKGNLLSHRLPVAGSMFLQDGTADKMVSDADDAWATFGHNRHATTGGKTYRAAHPFTMYDDQGDAAFCGMHNGTLTGWDQSKYVSDTQWAMYKLQKDGVTAVNTMNGAYAFFWVDSQEDPNIINFIRNKERPMHMGFVKDKKIAVFASEPGMLYWLAQRNDITLEEESVLCLNENTHYQFNIKDARKYTTTEIVRPATTNASSHHRPAGANAGPYQPDRATQIIAGIRSAFSSAAAAVTPPTTPVTAPVTTQLTPPVGFVMGDKATEVASTKGTAVTKEEIIAARTALVYQKQVDFVPDSYDPVANIYFGTVAEHGKASMYGEIRNLHQTLKRQLDRCEVATCKVIGLSSMMGTGKDDTDMLVLTKPWNLLMNDGTIIDRTVARSIDEEEFESNEGAAAMETIVQASAELHA